jgi:hypothetical protein
VYTDYVAMQYENYRQARDFFLTHPERLLNAEKYVMRCISETLQDFREEFTVDYNEASYLYPFWGSYPPDDRGNRPTGDQFPWIEVGEHTVGHKAERLMGGRFNIREVGLPSGSDDRYELSNSALKDILGITDGVMVFLDTKSTGPTDNDSDLVLSGYQVSGDGIWDDPKQPLRNSVILAHGKRATSEFQPRLAPVYCLTDGRVIPSIHLFLKTLYSVDPRDDSSGLMEGGQPLNEVTIACMPNGLLMFVNPDYHDKYPRLFYPGKDDKSVPTIKRRVRVGIDTLKTINSWRVRHVQCSTPPAPPEHLH